MRSGQLPQKLDQIAQGLLHPSSETPQRWRFHHLLGQTAPALNQPLWEDFFPYAHLELQLQQIAAIASDPPAVHLWKKPSSVFFPTLP